MTDLKQKTAEELIARIKEIDTHHLNMLSGGAYLMDVLTGNRPTPFDDFESDDEWNDYDAIDDELAKRPVEEED